MKETNLNKSSDLDDLIPSIFALDTSSLICELPGRIPDGIGVVDGLAKGMDSEAENATLTAYPSKLKVVPQMTASINASLTENSATGVKNNVFIADLHGRFSKSSLLSQGLESIVEDEFSVDGESQKVLKLRTFVDTRFIHTINTGDYGVVSVETLTMDHPYIVAKLANKGLRDKVLNNLANQDNVVKIVKWLTGGKFADIGSKRYTRLRLFRQLGKILGTGTHNALLNDELLLSGMFVDAILDQLDWRFSTLEAEKVIDPNITIMSSNDIKGLYIEGWLQKQIPANGSWIMKYSGSSKVTPVAVEELIVGSIVNLKRHLVGANLLDDRVSDVLMLARLQACINMGVIPHIADETINAILASSADIRDMATWYSITSDLINVTSPQYINTTSKQLKSRVGDVELMVKLINNVASCVREHALVNQFSVGQFVDHISVRHDRVDSSDNSMIYHTGVYSALLPGANELYHYTEEEVGHGLYSHLRVTSNDKFTAATTTALSTVSRNVSEYIVTRNSKQAADDLASIYDAKDIPCHPSYYVTISGVTNSELNVLSMIHNDVVISYVEDNVAGDTRYVVFDVAYIVKDASKFGLNPLDLYGEEAYTKNKLLATCMNLQDKTGTGRSMMLVESKQDLASKFLVSAVGNAKGRFSTVKLPTSISLAASIKDGTGQSVQRRVDLGLRNYINMANGMDTVAFIPDAVSGAFNMIVYGLTLASSAPRFKHNTGLGYEDERAGANFLIEFCDAFDKVGISKYIEHDARFMFAQSLSNSAATWNATYHNLQLRLLTYIQSVVVPFQLLAIGSKAADGSDEAFTWLGNGLNVNRLFRDVLLGRITKEVK